MKSSVSTVLNSGSSLLRLCPLTTKSGHSRVHVEAGGRLDVERTIRRSYLLRDGFAVRVTIDFDVVQIAFIVGEDDDLDGLAIGQAKICFEDGTMTTGQNLALGRHQWSRSPAILHAEAVTPARAELIKGGVCKLLPKGGWRGILAPRQDEVRPEGGTIRTILHTATIRSQPQPSSPLSTISGQADRVARSDMPSGQRTERGVLERHFGWFFVRTTAGQRWSIEGDQQRFEHLVGLSVEVTGLFRHGTIVLHGIRPA